MNKDFWKNKKVMLTGHTGFKGSWLSIWLQSAGARLLGYALDPPTDPNHFNLANVVNGMESVVGDIRDINSLKKTAQEFDPEIIIHFAAQPLVRLSYELPIETIETNVLGTAILLETVRSLKSARVVICITTDKCYENREWHWGYREIEPMGGHDLYSASKGSAELIISSYRRSFFPIDKYNEHGVAIASTRAGNVIGGGDWAQDRLIPDIMKTFIKNKPVIIRSPYAIRPWQHVIEPLNGYLILAEKLFEEGPKFAEGWNFGPTDEDAKPVSWIVDKLVSLWGQDAKWELDSNINPHEANYLKLDCSKANALLDWRPKTNLQTALEWIVEWYRDYQRGGDVRTITEKQIYRFEKL
ncbi:MAG: CDP-glucose 4,6-dehydratase [Ignavibacteriae bacterium]|nr:CDP-glucose 4,6-dehydratase [Ignavibacteriota bacterium]NOH00336.1 CDP-glucose 4,6-dehydratase [Ignavibacteriota bacterium]